MNFELFYSKYLARNHLVIASVEGNIFGDIISEHYTSFFAKRSLARMEKNRSIPSTGIEYSYQKNGCF